MHWRDCTGVLTHTTATCSSFSGRYADDLLSSDINYGLKNGCISTISPGVFFYYTPVKAPSAASPSTSRRPRTTPAFPFIPVM